MGSHWLSGTLERGDHEGSSPGEGDLGGVTSSRRPSAESHVAIAQPRGIAVCPGQLSPRLRQHVTATSSLARWFCYMLNSARKISILNWRWLTAVANIEKCSFLKAFGKSSTFSIQIAM